MTRELEAAEQLIGPFLNDRPVSGTANLGGFRFALDPALPYIATSIHSGTAVRDEVMPHMTLPEKGRFKEEDPATDEMISGLGSSVMGLDSRFEYDLNRPPWRSISVTPEQAWGLVVYGNGLPDDIHDRSLEKFEEFYRFMELAAKAIVQRHGRCVIYDMHSYNIERQQEKGIASPPVFNLGTELLDRRRWAREIDAWLDALKSISVLGVEVTAAENKVFFGKGELCRRLIAVDQNILVLPTEISKVYMNENTGEPYPDKIAAFKAELARAVKAHQRASGLR